MALAVMLVRLGVRQVCVVKVRPEGVVVGEVKLQPSKGPSTSVGHPLTLNTASVGRQEERQDKYVSLMESLLTTFCYCFFISICL